MTTTEFISLQPTGLASGFNIEKQRDVPLIKIQELDTGQIRISYIFPGFTLTTENRQLDAQPFKQVNMSKVGFLAESGKPLLPSFGHYVQIPFNCDFEIEYETGDPLLFDDILILPAQQRLRDEGPVYFELEEPFYSQDGLYPQHVVHGIGPFEMDGYNALLLHIRPIQYNPAKKQLKGYGNVNITLNVMPREDTDATYSLYDSRLSREAFGNLFLNPRRGIEARLGFSVNLGVIQTAPSEPELLIVHDGNYRNAVEQLATWKRRRGLRTECVSLETIGKTVEEIKVHIRNRIKDSSGRFRYVLLFGDTDSIPAERIEGGPYGANITDFYYSTEQDVKGSVELVFPRLSVGRIPVSSEEEAETVVSKIINYEQNPPTDPQYYRRMVFAAHFEDIDRDGNADRAYVKTMESVRAHLVELGYDVQRVYVSDSDKPQQYRDGTGVPDEVIGSFVDTQQAAKTVREITENGMLLAAYRGHGNRLGWRKPRFTTVDLENLQNKAEIGTIIFSVNCLTGKFDALSDSFAEKLLKMKGGAPSLIAASRLCQTWLNNYLMKAIFDAMWAGVITTYPIGTASYPLKCTRIGDILNYAKLYLPLRNEDKVFVKDHFEVYHVIGDPTLELWKSAPQTVDINANISEQGILSVVLSACPYGGILTIWHQQELIKRIELTSTQLTVSLRDIVSSLHEDEIALCFWAPGFRYTSKTI